MKKIIILFSIIISITSCKSDDDVNTTFNPKFKFTFNWDGQPVNLSDFNDVKYTNHHGEELSITRMRYLISNIAVTNANDITTQVKEYNLADLTNQLGLEFTSDTSLDESSYKSVSFTVGFDETANAGVYTDLNSVNWNWPNMLGGGYHIMQYEGKYLDSNNQEQIYAIHMGTRRVSMNPNVFEPNHFNVVVDFANNVTINSNSEIEIKMNIAEWFKNPNSWNLNVFNAPLMPVYEAQVMMHENGNSVFSVVIN